MARGVPGFVRIGAALAGCALVAACTPDPAPPATPTPAPPSTTSATPSATPTETDIERQQRLDFEAAENAYRASISEQDRLARLGTATATPELKRTSADEYLKFALAGLEEFEDAGWRSQGDSTIVGVSRRGWQGRRIGLTACEDGSSIKIRDKSGRDVTPDVGRKFVQDLTVSRFGDLWKVSDIKSKPVNDFKGAPCGS